MKGDFTRVTFDPSKNYREVLKQQGRVDLDADWNEASAIDAYLEQVSAKDLIGLCGVPKKNAGFLPQAAGGGLSLSEGRIYVNGWLCEIPAGAGVTYANQPHLPDPPDLAPEADRVDLVYLDVWQRHITALEDPELLDPALGGVDTTTRVQTVWQVRVRPDVGDATCAAELAPWPPLPPLAARGRLTTGAVVAPDPADPCLLAPSGGYGGLENRLYRVEVHDGGQRYAWPRPAGVTSTTVGGISDGTTVQVGDLALGGRGWSVGQVVELFSDQTDAGGAAGPLVRIVDVDLGASTLTLDLDVSSMAGHTNLRLRRVATFKWSRDNGSVAFGIDEFVSGEPNRVRVKGLGRDQALTLHPNDWVEVLGEESDLKGQPGTLTAIAAGGIDSAELQLTLAVDVSSHSGEAKPKLRRWDQAGPAMAVTTGVIDLEDGVEVQFGGQDFQTGDYWSFAARTATGQVEELVDAPPQGIEHAFCRLALIRWAATGDDLAAELVEDCRPTFPTLTEICAEDICYDNANCDAIQASNVQEALDQLCQMRDLRHHNKHLHGWGIVCGLQVHCGEDDPRKSGDRTTVVVQPGYAIDCEGNDIVLDDAMTVPVLEMIAAWDREHPDQPLLREVEGGRQGAVCLVIERGANGRPSVGLRPYDPKKNSLQGMLQGTLLMDLLQDCILEPLAELQDLLNPQEDEDGRLVGRGRRQLIALLNLIVQLWSPAHGRHVYLSHKEHDILERLYLALREILQSKTFCAMFDNARQFPDYPFPDARMTTIFDLNTRTRLRVHPQGRLGFAVGANNLLHIYDLEAEELAAVVEVPGGDGLVARDVAFSANGRQVYVAATLNNEDSIFAVADLERLELRWRPVTILCDVQLATLATVRRQRNRVFATGVGSGLYVIDVNELRADIRPTVEFNAVGHLVVDPREDRLFASAAAQGATPTAYTEIFEITLDGPAISLIYHLRADDQQFSGEDDIAVVMPEGNQRQLLLYAAAQPLQGGAKGLLVFAERHEVPHAFVEIANSTLRLGHVAGSPYLMVTVQDHYWVLLVDMRQNEIVARFHLPVQIAPIGIAVEQERQQVYVVNALSTTLTKVDGRYMQPDAEAGREPPPGSPEYLEQLIAYRRQIFEAFTDLLGGLVQYLKDCFCEHLLVNCPTCDEDDEVYLGCVEIRRSEVYKMCNFSLRTYVKSFPTVGYWLSLVPITPFIDKAIEQLCCLVLPDLFGRVDAPRNERAAPIKAQPMLAAVYALQQKRYRQPVAEMRQRGNLMQSVAGSFLGNALGGMRADAFLHPEQPSKRAVSQTEILAKPVEEVQQRLLAKEIQVVGVETFDRARPTENLISIGTAPLRIPAGSRVTLFEENGVVRYYKLAPQPSPEIKAVQEELATQRIALREVDTLRASVGDLLNQVAAKDKELATVRTQVKTLQRSKVPAEPSSERLAAMEAELQELRAFRDEVQRFMAAQKPNG